MNESIADTEDGMKFIVGNRPQALGRIAGNSGSGHLSRLRGFQLRHGSDALGETGRLRPGLYR